MILKNKKQIIRHQYTIVELLVVLVITGLLTGMSVTGIRGALARQGAASAVRTLATKLSLAQSFAVSKNRHVALLVPDYNGVNTSLAGTPVSDKTASNLSELWTNEYSSCFVKNRLCYVSKQTDGTYKFDRWVAGYEWQTLPSKTVAFIAEQSTGEKSTPVQVTKVPDPTNPNDPPPDKNSTALIFKPSGALVNASQIVVRIFRAAYSPGITHDSFIWQGTETQDDGWKIVINGYTGRSRFYLGGESIED
jgi:type II secretory pathway pseudopilin PulG